MKNTLLKSCLTAALISMAGVAGAASNGLIAIITPPTIIRSLKQRLKVPKRKRRNWDTPHWLLRMMTM